MLRACLIVSAAAAWIVLDAHALRAEAPAWPPMQGAFTRGPGFYLSPWKIASFWLLFAAWVGTTDWLSRDCLRLARKYSLWNSLTVGAFVGTLLLFWLMPWFWLGYFLLLASYVTPLTLYILDRNKSVDAEDKVLTVPHIRRWASEQAARLGIKLAPDAVDPNTLGPQIKFTARGGATARDDNANQIKARNMPGFLAAREALHAALERGGDGILLDYGRQAVALRYQLDGMWTEAPNMERAKGDPMLEVFKTLAAMNPAERRARQSGLFSFETAGKKFDCRITSQGTETGERAIMLLDNKKLAFKTLEELGMRPKIAEQVTELVRRKEGFLLFSSTPANGLTTTIDMALFATDRYIRNFVAIEDMDKPERDIENISVTTYDAGAGETPDQVLPKLIRTYPDVFVVRDLNNGQTVAMLCEQVLLEHRMVFSGIRAKEAVEALLRVLLLKVPPEQFAGAITAVLNSRLVRKLCEKCKEAYAPPAEVLQQLGLPAGKIAAFYRPPTPKPEDSKNPEKRCDACRGVGYMGRTGIFELLMIDDRMRQILTSSPKLELLRDAARKAKHRTLQEEGILLVVRGVTSLPEVLRVLKG